MNPKVYSCRVPVLTLPLLIESAAPISGADMGLVDRYKRPYISPTDLGSPSERAKRPPASANSIRILGRVLLSIVTVFFSGFRRITKQSERAAPVGSHRQNRIPRTE